MSTVFRENDLVRFGNAESEVAEVHTFHDNGTIVLRDASNTLLYGHKPSTLALVNRDCALNELVRKSGNEQVGCVVNVTTQYKLQAPSGRIFDENQPGSCKPRNTGTRYHPWLSGYIIRHEWIGSLCLAEFTRVYKCGNNTIFRDTISVRQDKDLPRIGEWTTDPTVVGGRRKCVDLVCDWVVVGKWLKTEGVTDSPPPPLRFSICNGNFVDPDARAYPFWDSKSAPPEAWKYSPPSKLGSAMWYSNLDCIVVGYSKKVTVEWPDESTTLEESASLEPVRGKSSNAFPIAQPVVIKGGGYGHVVARAGEIYLLCCEDPTTGAIRYGWKHRQRITKVELY